MPLLGRCEGGRYTIADVSKGSYDTRATMDGCHEEQTQRVVLRGHTRADFTLAARTDRFGYRCESIPIDWVEATDVLPLRGDDAVQGVALPFPVSLYDRSYDVAHVSTNGFLSFFDPDASFANEAIPSRNLPNAAVYPFWDDLVVDDASAVKTIVTGAALDRAFVIEFENVAFLGDTSTRLDFEVKLHERTGDIDFSYLRAPGVGSAPSATIGIENEHGDDALQVASGRPAIRRTTSPARWRRTRLTSISSSCASPTASSTSASRLEAPARPS